MTEYIDGNVTAGGVGHQVRADRVLGVRDGVAAGEL